ncbi:hypothetical protein [Steroidobacter gossypii]|uniref:hypothetical protein n=1 Tax=Steroidobacter gossypii TaxID=2805490 RepID=UPI001C3F854D|nr:hypothetical protein [Steroidobacter gossypii]
MTAARTNYRNSQAHVILCEVLIEAREKAGKSQGEVSADLQRPRTFCHLVEHRRRMLNAVELIPYAATLRTTSAAIMAEVERRIVLRRSPLQRARAKR